MIKSQCSTRIFPKTAKQNKKKNAFTNSKKEKEAARFASQYSSTALTLTLLGHAPLLGSET